MPKTNTSVALGEHFDTFIKRLVESGRYSSASEVMREALRDFEQRLTAKERLDKALRKGLADADAGRVVEASKVWDDLRAEFPWIE
jgi:antitoxin ParD1/3/4